MQQTELHPAVLEYLRAFELLIKQKRGVHPEEAISDAREFLVSELESLTAERTSDEEIMEHFHRKFGSPEEVAEEYAAKGGPIGKERQGYAPGWRICCTKCGISTPAAKAGITRVWAKSYHKYVMGYCRNCGRFRYMRLIQDLDKTNITDNIRLEESSKDFRERMHWPVLTILFILMAVVLSIALVFTLITLMVPDAFGA